MQSGLRESDSVLSGASGRRATVVYYPSVASAAQKRRSVERLAMTAAVVTLTVAQLLDLGTFIRMIARYGIEVEANPVVSHLIAEFGMPFVAVAKITALSLVVAVTVVLLGRPDGPAHPRLARIVVAVAVVAGLIGGWTNAATLI